MAYPLCGPCMSDNCHDCWGLCSCHECEDLPKEQQHSHTQTSPAGRAHRDAIMAHLKGLVGK